MDIASEFILHKDLIYLNHAAVSPWPVRTQEAVCKFAQENAQQGAKNYPHWLTVEQELKSKLQILINAASADDIALLKNTSEALSVVAYGLDWKPGDNIVITNMEFPSNRIVWESLQPMGVEVRYAAIQQGDSEAASQAVISLCDSNTRLVAVSSVQYSNGLRLNVQTLSKHCRQKNILFCVDAIQSIGAVKFDVQALDVDFAMADGHKWMLGPEGVALFYCRPELRQRLKLNQYGWHMRENYLDFDQTQWQTAQSARRFECGSPNMVGIHALHASLSLILQGGMDHVEAELLKRVQLMIDIIKESKTLQLLTPEQAQQSGIISFQHSSVSTEAMFDRMRKHNVVCAVRGGGIRFSPHFYTAEQQLIQALEIAAKA